MFVQRRKRAGRFCLAACSDAELLCVYSSILPLGSLSVKRREDERKRLEAMAEPFTDVDIVRAASPPFKSDPESTKMQLVWMLNKKVCLKHNYTVTAGCGAF